jgi:high-affinity iron transporter
VLRSSSSLRGSATFLAALAVAVFAAGGAQAAPAPWQLEADVRTTLANAERALILGEEAEAASLVQEVRPSLGRLAGLLDKRGLTGSLDELEAAVTAGDSAHFAAERAALGTAVLGAAYGEVLAALESGSVAEAQRWLLVREFRPPTRFSRPGADATLALDLLADGKVTPAKALAAVRADYLDTYQALLRGALETADEALERGFGLRVAAEAAVARGYFAILAPAYERQRGRTATAAVRAAFNRLVAAALASDRSGYREARTAIDTALEGFRAAPLSNEEEIRRAGQFLRFLALVPVEYSRGVSDGRVTVPFEIQEAITFRDGAAQAITDLEGVLAERDAAAMDRIDTLVAELGTHLDAATQGRAVAPPETIEATAEEALDLAERIFPDEWKDAGAAADFDVIRTSLDRVVNAVRAGEYATAEQARLEAYAFFEFGPEQRLRGLAPDLFARTEGLFWYGAEDLAGLAQLIRRKASVEEVAASREALDRALAESEAAVGAGPGSPLAVVTNTAIIVFREGLEAVLILAALTAGLVGAKRRLRRPLLLGAAAALVASVVTFVIAETVLSSLVRYGEKLEAIVSLIAVAVLLLILNWFFHRIYWADHLAGLHGRKKRILRGAGLSLAAAQLVGLATLGFTSVYREGFETVLFLQAFVLDAGVVHVAEGVALGAVGVTAVGILTIVLQRKLPHRRMLELTGLLILGVLVIMAGKTVQVSQVVGWLPVHPIGDLRLPYWAGLWFGVFPTWEGFIAQLGAAFVVLGSYFAAERMHARRRRVKLAPAPKTAPLPASVNGSAALAGGNGTGYEQGEEELVERVRVSAGRR